MIDESRVSLTVVLRERLPTSDDITRVIKFLDKLPPEARSLFLSRHTYYLELWPIMNPSFMGMLLQVTWLLPLFPHVSYNIHKVS